MRLQHDGIPLFMLEIWPARTKLPAAEVLPVKRRAVSRVGLDIAKSVFQAHGVDDAESVVLTKQLARSELLDWCAGLPKGCVVAMEACASSHYWGRQLSALGLNVRLIAPGLVTPYRMQGKTGKSDPNDAAAICEAASRPQMRFVAIKTPEQQALLALHTVREGFVKDRTACINRMRGVMAEFGLVLPRSATAFKREVGELLVAEAHTVPELARQVLNACSDHFYSLEEHIKWCDARISDHIRSDPLAKLAYSLTGVGKLGASALVATVGDASQFKNGRQFSAWLGLVPRQRGTGGRQKLGSITRRGDGYLRRLFVLGARSALRVAAGKDDGVSRWASQLCARIGWGKASVAVANRNARIVWRLLAKSQNTPADLAG